MNPGDAVECYRPGYLLHGQKGILLQYGARRMVLVRLESGAEEWFRPWELQPVEVMENSQ